MPSMKTRKPAKAESSPKAIEDVAEFAEPKKVGGRQYCENGKSALRRSTTCRPEATVRAALPTQATRLSELGGRWLLRDTRGGEGDECTQTPRDEMRKPEPAK